MKGMKRLMGLALSFCLLATSVTAVLPANAQTDQLPEHPEITLPDVTTENGLLWYKLDEKSKPAKNAIAGGEVRDSVETSCTFKPDEGVDGGAVQFSGKDYQHISINKDGNKDDLFLKDVYKEETVAFWFKPEKLTGIQMLYAQGGKVSGIQVRLNEGKLQVNVSTGAPNLLSDIDVSDSLNKWTHVTVVFDNGTASVYVNGVQRLSETTENPQMAETGVGTTIGNNHTRANGWDNGSSTREFKGMMDDLRIYKEAVVPQVKAYTVSGYEQNKTVPAGTTQSALQLPGSLTAAVSENQNVSLPVAWTSQPTYNGNTAGKYVFTAALPENVSFDGTIQTTVTVEAGDPGPAPEPTPMPDIDSLSDHPDIQLPDMTTENGLLWYPLDEAKQPIQNAIPDGEAHDAYEVIGTLKPTGGVDGGAIQFSGKDYQHVTINTDGTGSTFLKDAYKEETVAFWFKADRLSGIQMLYAQGDRNGGMAIRLNEGVMQASISTGSSEFLEDVDVSGCLGQWTHVALSFDNGQAALYINGEKKASKTTANTALGKSSMGTTFGNNHTRANAWDDGSSTREFQGMIDDLRIYKTAEEPRLTVRAFGGYEDKAVLVGTELADLHLPNALTAYISASQTLSVSVNWTSYPAYNANQAGDYVFIADFQLPAYLHFDGVVGFTVTVKEDDGKTDPELETAYPKAEKALSSFTASKATTAQDILDAVTRAVNNPNITITWKSDPVITLPADGESGSITGTILLSKGKYNKELAVDLLIPSLEDGLRLRYEFEDGKAVDVSGSGRDGQTYGTLKTADGINGQAMYFSGGYVKMPEDVIQGLTNFSVSVWIDALSDFQYARVWDIGSGENNFVNLWLRSDTERKYSCNIRLNESTTQRNEADTATFKTGTWRNLTVTYDEADNGRITIFEDGKQLCSIQTGKKLSQLGAATNALIGWGQMKNDYDFHGYMDDFRIYDRTLTAEEVGALTAEGTQSLVKNAASHLDIADFNGFSSLDGVVQDLNLQTASDILYSGASISWESSNPDAITADGKIANLDDDAQATLTATLTRDGKTASKEFPLTVKSDRTLTPDPVPDVVTVPGLYPDLPDRITANNGQASMDASFEEPTPQQYAGAGEFTLNGTAGGQDITVKVKVDSTLFTNPIIGPASPDPFFYYKDGYYYYIRSSYGGLTVSKAQRFQDIGNVPRIMVYSMDDAPDSIKKNWWAPEIHYLNDNWYIYWAANDGKSENHRMYVLESTDPNDAQAPYVLKGQLAPTKYNDSTQQWEVDASQDMWAIDGTVFENKDGRLYFLWAGYDGSAGNFQKLFISEMLNPWTLKGSRTLISEPELPFEIRGGGYKLNEGPQVITRGNKVHVLYSSCQANYDWYSLGLLTADADDDLLDASSWKKNPGPVFTKSNNSADESFGTGHAMVVQSPDGTEDWLIYHAYIIGNTTGHTGDMEERCTRAVKISWDENDMPIFGNPVAFDVLQEQPSGTPDATALKYEAETAELTGNAKVVNKTQASGRKIVENIDQDSSVIFTVDAPKAGRYLVSFMGNSRSETGHTGYQNVNINGTDYKIWHRGNNKNAANKWIPSCLADAQQIGQGLYVWLPEGVSTITVTMHKDAGAVCDLDYLYLLLDKEGEPQPEISLDKETLTLKEGESAQLTATVTPAGDKVSYTSSNTDVATVDADGRVTAVKAGTAVITAETSSGAKATCTVTVTEKEPIDPDYDKGDLDKDGKVTIADVMEACKILARKSAEIDPSDEEIALGDLDDDGDVTIADVMEICKILARNK